MGVEDPVVRIGIIPFACVDANFHRRRGEPGNWLARLEMSNDIRDRKKYKGRKKCTIESSIRYFRPRYGDMEEVEVVKWDRGRENSEDPLRDETICDFRASS